MKAIWKKVTTFFGREFLLGPDGAMEKFLDVAERLRRMLDDKDSDGMPDKLAHIMHQVTTAVELLELAIPSSGAVRRGSERLATFRTQLSTHQSTWRFILPMIEAALLAIKSVKK